MMHQSEVLKLLREDVFGLNGVVATLDGQLIVNTAVYIEISDETQTYRLVVADFQNFRKRLLATVDHFVGGDDLYNDPVRVIAHFTVESNGNSYISSVESGVAHQNGCDRLF